MKRTPLRRVSRKKAAGLSAAIDLRREYLELFGSCACCRRTATFGVVIDVHHMVSGRMGKPDDRRNFLSLCRFVAWTGKSGEGCHPRLDKSFGLPYCLTLKQESDPDGFDLAWLREHHTIGELPEAKPVPEEWRR